MHEPYSHVLEPDATLDDLARAGAEFWGKLKACMARVPFARDAVALFYLMRDPAVPFGLRGSAALALLYFISPLDLTPDFIPMFGFVDDALVIAAAIAVLSGILTPYRERADDWLSAGARPEPEIVKPVQIEQS